MSCSGSGVSSPKKAQRVSGTFPPVPKHLCCDAVSWLSADWCPLKLKPPGRLITLRLPAVSSCLGTLKNGRCWRQHYKDNLLKNTSTSIQFVYHFADALGCSSSPHQGTSVTPIAARSPKLTAPVLRCFNRFGQQVHFRTLWDKWSPPIFVSDVCLSSPLLGAYPLFVGLGHGHWNFLEKLVIPWQRHRSAPLAEEVRQLPLGTAWTTNGPPYFRAEWSRLPWARSWKIHLTPLKKNYYCQIRI